MNDFPLLVILPLVTIGIVMVLAAWSKVRTDRLNHNRTSEKSSLAKDGPGPQPFRAPGNEVPH